MRERLGPGQLAAIPLSLAGVALVLVGGEGVGTVDAAGVLPALGCAVVYSGFMLLTHSLVARVPPMTLSASVCTGALVPFLGAVAIAGDPALPSDGEGWEIVVGIALLCTVLPVAALIAGTGLAGPSAATILSASQPALTAALAFAFLGETLNPVQLVGGALVLCSVVVVQARWPLRSPEPIVGGGA